MLDVNIFVGARTLRTSALIDSGADRTLLNRGWAKPLGIEWKKGRPYQTYGIAHGDKSIPIPIFIHTVDIEIINMPNSRCSIEIGFIDSRNVNMLLGQFGFLDRFRVTLDQPNGFIDIERAT